MAATITLSTVQTELALWLSARSTAATGQSFTLNGRTLNRQDLKEIDNMVNKLSRQERTLLERKLYTESGEDPRGFGYSVARF